MVNMIVKFTEFTNGTNWVSGIVNGGEYHFSAKLFDEGSDYGIMQNGYEGRVSKLFIATGDSYMNLGFEGCICNYDRGWDILPRDIHVFEAIMDKLESSPKRFE
jgi:NDP-sugar pyrophosphorylase family protein